MYLKGKDPLEARSKVHQYSLEGRNGSEDPKMDADDDDNETDTLFFNKL
jgi:hypothetical protein